MPGTAHMPTIEARRLPEGHGYRVMRLTGFPRRTFNINTIAEVSRRSGALVLLPKTVEKNERGGMDPVMMVPGGAKQQLLQRLKAEFGSAVRVCKTYPEGYVVAEDEKRASSAIVRVNTFPVGPPGRGRQSSQVKKMYDFLQQEASQLGVENAVVCRAGDGFSVNCHSSDNANKVLEGFSTLNGVVYEGVLLACLQKAKKSSAKKNRDTASEDSTDSHSLSSTTATCSSADETLLYTPPHMQCSTWSHQPYSW